jgi:ribosome biogenesis GTPase
MIDIDFGKLRPIGLTPFVVSRLAALNEPSSSRVMRVIETQRDACTLHDGEREFAARLLPRLGHDLQLQSDALTVGDWVAARFDANGEVWIEQRMPPVTQIARRANDGRRQVLASNVDTALLAMGLDADFNPRRVERYIAMVRACGVEPVVVLTKADISTDAEERIHLLRGRLPANVPIVAVDAKSKEAREQLAPWLDAGRTLVLLGASGVGKSTLTNTLTDAAATGISQPTGPVRQGDGRGRHTTTVRSLHLCSDGACIIDTPGLRTWRPDAGEQELAAAFDDVQRLAPLCQFRDCRHENEPGCAVRNSIPPDRLLNYQKLMRDAQRAEETPLQRIAQRRKWKTISKAGGQRAREKRQW